LTLGGAASNAVEDLGSGRVHDGAMLPDIETRAREAKGRHLASKAQQIGVGDRSPMMRAQARIEQVEVGGELVCRVIRAR
jgi:hypothetical protein